MAFGAAPVTLTVRHRHARKGALGTLRFSGDGLRYDEAAKRAAHSRMWKYTDLQRFELAPDHIRVVTYEDVRNLAGRDLAYVFDHIPGDAAQRLYPLLAAKLDRRFIAWVPASAGAPLWEAPAKMLRGTGGANGTLRIAADCIVFESATRSRTWRTADVLNFSSSGPFELTLTTLDGESRFQLKQALAEDRYNELWRRFNPAPGLKTTTSTTQEMHYD
jgi:hypothetical protein